MFGGGGGGGGYFRWWTQVLGREHTDSDQLKEGTNTIDVDAGALHKHLLP